MEIPGDLKYHESHEWVKVEGDVATIGITDFAQAQLGDIVFVDLPEKGKTAAKGDTVASIESSKAVGELIMPVGGEIVDVNAKISDAPETINSSPYGDGWIIKVKMSDAGEAAALLDAAKYKDIAKE
jgi:glycine cleavage system H protein